MQPVNLTMVSKLVNICLICQEFITYPNQLVKIIAAVIAVIIAIILIVVIAVFAPPALGKLLIE